jgi:hypothetical protein
MSALSRKPDVPPLVVPDWQGDVTQLLDEAHLIAWSEFPQRRTQFAVQLGQFLGSLKDAEVCVLYGKFITDLDTFCYQLERAIPGPALERRIHGPSSIVSLLRERPSFHGRAQSKYGSTSGMTRTSCSRPITCCSASWSTPSRVLPPRLSTSPMIC